MIRFKKIAASVAALTAALSLSVGTLAVTASEAEKVIDATPSYSVSEKQFIASYEDEGVANVAAYFIDNGVALTEAKKMVELYIDGNNRIKSVSTDKKNSMKSATDTVSDFYSTSDLSSNQHHGVGITTNGSANVTFLHFGTNYSTSWISVNSSLPYNVLSSNAHLNQYQLGNNVVFHGNHSNLASTNKPAGLFEYRFNVVMSPSGVTSEEYTEANLREQLSTSISYTLGSGSTDTDYDFETYVSGDVDHNGIVNTMDYSWLVNYNLQTITQFPDDYADVDADIAQIVNTLAADADGNGIIELADINWIAQHLES